MTKKQNKPQALLFIGDIHAGAYSAVATALDAQDEDDTPLSPSPKQKELYSKLQELLTITKKIALTHDITICLGADMVDGYQHHGSNTWGTPDDQRNLAIKLLMPFANIAAAIYGLLGTDSHAGVDGNDDKAVVRELGGKAKQRWILDHNGVLIDWAHHASGGIAPAKNLINKTRLECMRTGDPLPSLIIRHHLHRYDHDENNTLWNGETKRIQAAICPCWKLPDSYTRKVAPASFPDIGALMVFPNEEKITPIIFRYHRDIITKL